MVRQVFVSLWPVRNGGEIPCPGAYDQSNKQQEQGPRGRWLRHCLLLRPERHLLHPGAYLSPTSRSPDHLSPRCRPTSLLVRIITLFQPDHYSVSLKPFTFLGQLSTLTGRSDHQPHACRMPTDKCLPSFPPLPPPSPRSSRLSCASPIAHPV